MNRKLFYDRYKKFDEEEQHIEKAIKTILQFEDFVGKTIEETSIEDIVMYVDNLIDISKNSYENVIHIARYYYYIDFKEHYIHMTKYFNSLGVLENIIDRISIYEDNKTSEEIISKLELPPMLTDSKKLPSFTKKFMDILQTSSKHCNKILAGNNHQIPESASTKEKEYYQQSSSFKKYLEERHARKVQELQEHYDQNKIWFEQIITPDVIDFVRDNPEILSGVIEEDTLYITKIPYDVKAYLEADTKLLKRYHTCHCSFVKENIKNPKEDIAKEWCYCSGGFAKQPFEVILGQDLEVTLLETPLDGNYLCRFAIDLKNIVYKQ